MNSNDFAMPLWAWLLLALLLFGQGLWIYRDAARRGRPALLWGLFGLLNFPSSLLVYLVATRGLERGRKDCEGCGGRLPPDAAYCPRCGRAVARPDGPGGKGSGSPG